MSLSVRIVDLDALDTCIAIRREVFVVGQDVPEDLEVDGLDPVCHHVLATLDDRPVGTARLREVDGIAKVERVAVLQEVRGHHVGLAVMAALHDHARALGLTTAKLNAQTYVIGWYERQGYVAYGPEFLDAGIPHRAMKRML